MNSYWKKLPFNHFHYYAFAVLISLLGIYHYLFFLLYIPFFYLLRFYQKKQFIIIIIILFLVYFLTYEKIFKVKPSGNTFTITEKIKNDTYYTYYVKKDFNKYLFYSEEQLNIGDVVVLDYRFEEFTKNKTPNGFNLKQYYASKRVFYKLIVKDIKTVNNKPHHNKIKEKIIKGIENYPSYTKKYLKMFLFSIDNFESELKEAKISLGIVHLFLLSGIHINFIITFLSFITKKLNLNLNKKFVVGVLLILLYCSGFSVSLLRVVITYVLFQLFKKRGLTRLDALSLSFLFILLINPFYRFQVGFILSYLISFMLVITPFKNTLKERFIVHLKVIFLSLLIISNINGKIYPLSIISGFLFTITFPVIILPIIFLSIIPFLHVLTEPLLSGFTKLILTLETNLFFKMPYQGLFSVFIYLVIFIYAIYEENNLVFFKRSFLLLIFLLFVYISPGINFNSKIFFLDVDQGDATFIQNKYNDGNILIDANNGTKTFLKTLGNIEIDYFFITHGDLDHAAEAKDIIEEFKVNNIIISPYDNSPVIKNLSEYNLTKATIGEIYKINDIKIRVLGPLKRYNDLNNNSLILQIEMFDDIFLFTGDAEKEAIDDLIRTYQQQLKSDVLHVSHHGAYGGTPVEFLECVRPKEAIISVGKNNFYNHPHPATISNLELYNVKIYLTSKQQTIIKRKYQFSF